MSMEKEEKLHEEDIDRRSFVGRVAAIGGAVAGLAALGAVAEAAPVLTQPGLRLGGQAAPPKAFASAFAEIKQMQAQGPRADERWVEPLKGLGGADRLAAVAALESSQRNPKLHDVGQKLGILIGLLAAGLATRGISPGSVANGEGCGNQCGGGCLSDVAGGFICGNNCKGSGFDTGEAEAAGGFICGNNCSGFKIGDFAVDPAGVALKGVNFHGLSLHAVSSALTNAGHAYGQTFGG